MQLDSNEYTIFCIFRNFAQIRVAWHLDIRGFNIALNNNVNGNCAMKTKISIFVFNADKYKIQDVQYSYKYNNEIDKTLR